MFQLCFLHVYQFKFNKKVTSFLLLLFTFVNAYSNINIKTYSFILLQISLVPNFPSKICHDCKSRIQDIYSFHQTINQNEIILQQKCTTDVFKTEIKLETIYDDNNETVLIEPLHKDKTENMKPEMLKQSNSCIYKEKKLSILYDSNNVRPSNETEKNIDTKYSLKKEETAAERKQFTCLTCFKEFSSQLKLLKHYQTVELDKFNEKNKINKNDQNECIKYKVEKSDDNLIYKCERCGKRYSQKTYIVRHIFTHTGRRPFLCKLCGKYLTYISFLFQINN